MSGSRTCLTSALLLLAGSCGTDAAAPSLRGLRAAPAPAKEGSAWTPLGHHRVAKDEGRGLLSAKGDLEFCEELCSNYDGCKSFAFCGAECFLKDAAVTAETPSVANPVCSTYYLSEASAPSPPSTPTPEDSGSEAECRSFTSDMVVNQRQRWAGNPDDSIHGTVEMTLCSNGTMIASMQIEGGHSAIIASHIHHCVGGDSHQTETAVLCRGPPVANFCGSNSHGLSIADGTPYSGPCSGFDASGSSVTSDMHGHAVKATTSSASDLVADIFANPSHYYFNVHTIASFTHWFPGTDTTGIEGSCRGPVQPKVETTPAPAVVVENKCYDLYSQMAMNELQKYPGNPDSNAFGYASFRLCTNGTLEAQSLVFGGKSRLIAMHVHRCEGGDSPQTRTSELCTGPPVLNFCGSNAAGLINDGTPYAVECADYGSTGASKTSDVPGAFVVATNPKVDLAELVMDIVQHPELYYFNAHSLASYTHWYPGVQGMCRGPMQLSS